MNESFLRIGGLTLRLRGPQPFHFSPPVARFQVPESSRIDCDLRVERATVSSPRGQLLFDSGGVWKLFGDPQTMTVLCTSPAFDPPEYKAAVLSHDWKQGNVVVSDEQALLDPLAYPLDELVVGNLLGRGEGIELHACGLIDRGQGILFVGQSEAGKTTMSRLWSADPDVRVLSDDRLIVRRADGALRVYGTPWHGEESISLPEDAPLRAIFLLEKSPENRVRSVEASEAVARLYCCAFPVLYHRESVQFAVAFLSEIVQEIPVRALGFRPGAAVVEYVRNLLP